MRIFVLIILSAQICLASDIDFSKNVEFDKKTDIESMLSYVDKDDTSIPRLRACTINKDAVYLKCYVCESYNQPIDILSIYHHSKNCTIEIHICKQCIQKFFNFMKQNIGE